MNRVEEMAAVAREAADCPRCDLAQARTHVVFGEGDPGSPLMLVGEGPGEVEDASGRPFVGPAGILLDQALHANRISRKYVYITNIVKCRATLVERNRIKNRPPRVQEVEACKPWLLRQIAIIRPLVILCVGGPAASLLIHADFRITSERGQWFDSSYAPAITATLHPAYVLRLDGEARNRAFDCLVRDIAAARDRVMELKAQRRQEAPQR